MSTHVADGLALTIKVCLGTIVIWLIAFVMSFYAEPFAQEVGVGQTILGYNRDFLVNGRWWFLGGIGLCLLMIASSYRKLVRL